MKLWLDDERMPPGDDWRVARTYREAVGALRTGKVRLLSLDHDLGKGRTGYDVAAWVEARAAAGKMGRLEWRVHSANPVGRARIEAAMRSAERLWDEGRV
jgi:hypothetical protein